MGKQFLDLSNGYPEPKSGPLAADPEFSVIRSGDGSTVQSPYASQFSMMDDSSESLWDSNCVEVSDSDNDY